MQVLGGLLILVLAVAVLVAGYYLGIFFAVIGAAVTALSILTGVGIFIAYAVWDIFQERKKRRRRR